MISGLQSFALFVLVELALLFMIGAMRHNFRRRSDRAFTMAFQRLAANEGVPIFVLESLEYVFSRSRSPLVAFVLIRRLLRHESVGPNAVVGQGAGKAMVKAGAGRDFMIAYRAVLFSCSYALPVFGAILRWQARNVFNQTTSPKAGPKSWPISDLRPLFGAQFCP